MIEELVKYDTELFLFLNSFGNESWDSFWRVVTLKWTWIPFYAFLLFLIYKKYGLKSTLFIMLSAAVMITATDQLSNLFKNSFERLRPCQLESLRETMHYAAVRCGKYGYFSAHAASSMSAAVFIGLLLKPYYKYAPFLLLFWSIIICYSRIYLGVHYPLDIVTGMVIGALVGLGAYHLQAFLRAKFIKTS